MLPWRYFNTTWANGRRVQKGKKCILNACLDPMQYMDRSIWWVFCYRWYICIRGILSGLSATLFENMSTQFYIFCLCGVEEYYTVVVCFHCFLLTILSGYCMWNSRFGWWVFDEKSEEECDIWWPIIYMYAFLRSIYTGGSKHWMRVHF